MRQEADAFIAAIPAGLQQHQADAVEDAIKGDVSLLEEVRNSRNNPPRYSDNVSVNDMSITGTDGHIIPMRLYSPVNAIDSEPLPLMVYFHGGGWTFGSLNSCARFCDSVASTGKAEVLAVDYRLAPENPFPHGLNDCIDAVEYAIANSEELGSGHGLVSVGGDSSGGNLALATALSLNRAGNQAINSIVLFYPVVRAESDNTESWNRYGEGYGLDAHLMDLFNKAYCSGGVDCTMKLISPMNANDEELRQLPPILMINAERDILASQGDEFAKRLTMVGGEIRHHVFPGTVHLFITVAGQEKAFTESVNMTASFLSRP